MTAAEIIEKFGGQSALAKLLDKRQSTIQHWYNNRIPAKWQKDILDLARLQGIDLKAEDFFTDPAIPEAPHTGDLKIGNSVIKCGVLEDGTRLLTRATFVRAIGRRGKAKGGRDYDDEFKTPVFLTAKNLKPFIPEELQRNSAPVIFRIKSQEYIGYKAELLPQVCGVFIDADEAGDLAVSQKHIAQKCRVLLRGFATVGIVALVDEVTGYQDVRDRLALQKILDKYLIDEWAKWTKRFPDDFYKHLFRLKGLPYPPKSMKKPQYVGHWTNDIIYRRLAPGVLKELKRKNPRQPSGHRKRKFHQYLTRDWGIPELTDHLSNVTFLMKTCEDGEWGEFKERLNLASPKYGDTIPLGLPFKKKKH